MTGGPRRDTPSRPGRHHSQPPTNAAAGCQLSGPFSGLLDGHYRPLPVFEVGITYKGLGCAANGEWMMSWGGVCKAMVLPDLGPYLLGLLTTLEWRGRAGDPYEHAGLVLVHELERLEPDLWRIGFQGNGAPRYRRCPNHIGPALE